MSDSDTVYKYNTLREINQELGSTKGHNHEDQVVLDRTTVKNIREEDDQGNAERD